MLSRRQRRLLGLSPVCYAPIGAVRSGILSSGRGIPDSGRVHWYDATEISGSDGDSIGSWTDQEGSDDLTQGTNSDKPTLKTGQINGNQVLRFDGSSDYMQTTTAESYSQPNNIFIAFEFQSHNTDGTNNYIFDGNASRESLSNDGSENWTIFAGSSVTSSGGVDNNTHIFSGLYNGSSSTGRIDGSQVLSGDAGSNALNGVTVGTYAGADSNFGNVDIGEVIIYDADLSDSDRDAVESYLADKWGVTLP